MTLRWKLLGRSSRLPPPLYTPDTVPIGEPVEFLNLYAATAETLNQHRISMPYRQLCRFFQCSLFDRTGTLQPGFPYRILDPLPPPSTPAANLAELCDQRGLELLTEALDNDRELRVFWSGGIDSTTALVALLRASDTLGRGRELIHVQLSRTSIREYRRFYRKIVEQHPKVTRFSHIIGDRVLRTEALNVTGECGDQLFGSALAERFLRQGTLFDPWREVFAAALGDVCSTPGEIDEIMAFLEPQLQRCPLPLNTLFDLLWWLSFSLKWQNVQLRLAVYSGLPYPAIRESMRHFFATPSFQNWSLRHHPDKIGTHWSSYKMPLKRYINDYFPDPAYLRDKHKEPSLQNPLDTRRKDRYFASEVGISIQAGVAGSLCAGDSDGGGE